MASNSLARKRPDLARQWHPTLNGTVKPKDIPYSSGKYYHWLCDFCLEDTDEEFLKEFKELVGL